MSARLTLVASDDAVIQRAIDLQAEGMSPVIVTTRQGASSLGPDLAGAGLDVERLWLIDATGAPETDTPLPMPVTRVRSPKFLELISLRCEQAAAALQRPHVVLAFLDHLDDHNDRDGLDSFVRYMTSRLTQRNVGVDFMLLKASPARAALEDRVRLVVPSRLDLAKA